MMCLLLVLAPAVPVSAQRAGATGDTTKTRAQLIQELLRRASPLLRDSIIADSLRADSLGTDSLRIDSVGRLDAQLAPPAAGLSGVTRDSIMEALLRLSGYAPTEYKAGVARFEADSGRLDLRRQAEVVREGQRLVADSSIVFSQETNIACAYGRPTLSGQGMSAPLTADSLCYNTDTQLGVARGATTEISEGANWIVYSREVFTRGDTAYTHDGIFTDCNLEVPHYHFAAGEIKVVRGDLLVARNVTFNFQDVPVFWLPFFAQSMKSGRRSGLLTPGFTVNDIFRNRSDYQRGIENVGFYWAVSENFGFESAMDWRSDDYTALRGTLDFRFLRQFLQGSATYRNFWKAEGGRDFTVAGRGDWQPDERTRVGADVSYATSTRFVRERSLDPRELNRSITSNAGVSRRFGFGSLQLNGQREQYLSDNTVSMVLPSVSLSLTSITLFEAAPGDEKFFSNAIWTGSANARRSSRTIDNVTGSLSARGREELNSTVTSSFTLGRLSWSQDFGYADVTDLARDFQADSLMDLPRRQVKRMTWGTGINFQQRLMGSTTFTPGLRLRGEVLQGDTTGGASVAAPTRLDFNAALRTDLYAFLPGVGPIQTMRHKVSPSLSYTYSPSPTITDRQRQYFAIGEIREQNRLSIGLSQTFEAKMRRDSTRQPPEGGLGTPRDSLAADSSALQAGPRRRETIQPLRLLSINTDAIVYDFVRAREDGEGIQTMEISNNIQSDLFRGLQFSFTHDLFRQITADTVAGIDAGREFKPHLSRVSASFSVGADSWLARLAGLGRSSEERQQAEEVQREASADSAAAADTTRLGQLERPDADFGVVGRGRSQEAAPRQPAGNWNATFSYSLFRPRSIEGAQSSFAPPENQMLTASVSFQPTLNWAVQWNTGYNFTQSEFTDHIFTLTRQLHDWDANFDFVKTQTGNFSFQFRVHLRANPDIKLDYEQRDLAPRTGTGIR
jgi:hypothetical protein